MTVLDPAALAALITAFVSLFVALYQTWARRRDAIDIEELKSQLEREKEAQGEYLKRYLEFLLEGKERELTAFREMLKGVQAILEKIRTVSRPSHSYDPVRFSEELTQMSNDLIDCFAANQTFFSSKHFSEAHTLKNKSIYLAAKVSNYVIAHPRDNPIVLPSDIVILQDELTSLQHKFRELAFTTIKSLSDALMSKCKKES